MKRVLGLAMLLLLCVGCIRAADVGLAWDPSPSEGVIGYKVHQGNSSGVYIKNYTAGPQNSYTVQGLGYGTYYFAVSAYTSAGLESGFSNEVSSLIELTAPSNLRIIEIIVSKNGDVKSRSISIEEYESMIAEND